LERQNKVLEGLREFDPRMGERLIERDPLSGKQKKPAPNWNRGAGGGSKNVF